MAFSSKEFPSIPPRLEGLLEFQQRDGDAGYVLVTDIQAVAYNDKTSCYVTLRGGAHTYKVPRPFDEVAELMVPKRSASTPIPPVTKVIEGEDGSVIYERGDAIAIGVMSGKRR